MILKTGTAITFNIETEKLEFIERDISNIIKINEKNIFITFANEKGATYDPATDDSYFETKTAGVYDMKTKEIFLFSKELKDVKILNPQYLVTKLDGSKVIGIFDVMNKKEIQILDKGTKIINGKTYFTIVDGRIHIRYIHTFSPESLKSSLFKELQEGDLADIAIHIKKKNMPTTFNVELESLPDVTTLNGNSDGCCTIA